MKKQPIQTTSKPSYPTLSEARSALHDNKLIKGTATALIIAATALSATGCVDSTGSRRSGKGSDLSDFINKITHKPGQDIVDIMGDMSEPTEAVLDGEGTIEYPEPTDTDSYHLAGDVAAPVETNITESTEDIYELDGDVAYPVEN